MIAYNPLSLPIPDSSVLRNDFSFRYNGHASKQYTPAQYFSYSLAKDVYVFEVTASLEVQAHEEGLIIGGLLHALTLTGFLCVHPDLVALLQLVVGLLVVFLVQLARCHAQVFLNHQSQVFKLQGKLQC